MTTQTQNVTLPYIPVRWSAAAVVVGVTFIRYNIYRRIAGSGVSGDVRIATISDQSVTEYRDYAAEPWTQYEYSVTQTATIGANTLESAKPTPVAGIVRFDWLYIHDMLNPAANYLAFFSHAMGEDVQQDVDLKTAWGRQAPTAFVGDLDASALKITGLPDVMRGEIWTFARPLMSRQRTDSAVYCVRNGKTGQRWFCNIRSMSRRNAQGDYSADIDLAETFYDEAV